MRFEPFAMLSLRYWRRRAGRALGGVVGVALGVAVVVAVVAVNRAVVDAYAGWVDALSGGGIVELQAIDSAGVDARLTARVRKLPGVQAASGVVEQRSYLFTERQQSATTVRGIEPRDAFAVAGRHLLAGRLLEARDVNATVLSREVAEALEVGIGGNVSLLSADGLLQLSVVGITEASELERPLRDRTALIPLSTARAAFLQGREVVTRVEVQPGGVGDLAGLKQRLREAAGDGVTVRLPTDQLRALTEATTGLRALLLLAAAMALVAALFLIANNLAASGEERAHDLGVLRALGLPRRPAALWYLLEAGVMGAIGSLLGGLLGSVAAGGLWRRLPTERLLPPSGPAIELGFDLAAVLGGVVVGVLVTLLVALPVALRGARPLAPANVPPLNEPAPRPGRYARAIGPLLMGLVVVAALLLAAAQRSDPQAGVLAYLGTGYVPLGMALVLVAALLLSWSLPRLFGGLSESVRSLPTAPLWLRFATDSLRRHARRTGVTAVSLSITLASMVGVYGASDSYRQSLVEWLDATVNWDLLVTGGPLGAAPGQPLSVAAVADLAAVEGVAAVLPERLVTVATAGKAVDLLAYDATAAEPSRRPQVVTAVARGALEELLLTRRGVALSLTTAARLGLAAGDELRLAAAAGERSFTVVATVEGSSADAAGAYIDGAVYREAFGDMQVDQVGVRLAADSGEAAGHIPALAAAVRARLGERYPVQVISAAAYRQEAVEGLGAAFAVVRALVLLAVVVAIVGLFNALLIGLWQLRRQFVLLRALGAPTTMLLRTVSAEALLTTAAGAVCGLLLGTLLSAAVLYGLTPLGGPLPEFRPPYRAYLDTLALLLAAVLLGGSLLLGRLRLRPPAPLARAD